MIEFQCDYAEGAHPKILERMIETNIGSNPDTGWILIVMRRDV